MGINCSAPSQKKLSSVRIRNSSKSVDFSKAVSLTAIFSFRPPECGGLSFDKGDLLEGLVVADKQWWLSRRMDDGEVGLVPRNMVELTCEADKVLDAWHDWSNVEASQRLVMSGQQPGVYILRPCSDSKHIVLSVCHLNSSGSRIVIHYKIIYQQDQFFIEEPLKFNSLGRLIKSYFNNQGSLCCLLRQPLKQRCSNLPESLYQLRSIELDRNKLCIGKLIGSGNYGEVFKAHLKDANVEVAVKKMLCPDGKRKIFLKEARAMQQLNHRRIVKLIGVCTRPESDPVFIVTELMTNGSLKHFLKQSGSSQLSYHHLLIMLKDISEGMEYLESRSYLHRDLRAANILVDNDLSVKVADFGLIKLLDDVYMMPESTYEFPIRWMPIEYVLDNKFNIRSDVWSFGIVMFEMITFGQTPYPSMNNHDVIQFVRLKSIMSQPQDCPTEFYDLMKSCWQSHKLRPSFKELCRTINKLLIELDVKCS